MVGPIFTSRLCIIALCWFLSSTAAAHDQYSDVVFTAAVFMYWCTYGELPGSFSDLAKVTDIDSKDTRLTLDPDEWFDSIEFQIEGRQLRITRSVETTQDGRTVTRTQSSSTSDCDSFRSQPQ
jgi:hypothetical protein